MQFFSKTDYTVSNQIINQNGIKSTSMNHMNI